ncbi:MAG TPA: GTPase HflX, partial [Chloroflexota bacterium]|nr:GTPase HflX [Chloroflexota bacterium]
SSRAQRRLIAAIESETRRRALLVAVENARGTAVPIADSLAELAQLTETAGDEVVGDVIQHLEQPHPVSYVGKGKLQEIRELRDTLQYDAVIADDELTPTQQRHLEGVLDTEVADRTSVILHLFAMHARTREGRLQVELAQYRYRLPRLTGRGIELSRLGAGINTRGPGETKLETDRRRIRTRIATLNRELEEVRRQRSLHRRQRSEAGMPVLALAGYTNAGKSSLMNGLTAAGVLSSREMFATLDPTTRQLRLPNDLHVLVTDTVGFIQKLPTDLVAAFRSTLEEIQVADVILHVMDMSHPLIHEQEAAVEGELAELGVAARPRLQVLNKADRVDQNLRAALTRRWPEAVVVSALTGEGIPDLRERISRLVTASFIPVRVNIPYARAQDVNLFHTRGMIEKEDHRSSGTIIVGKLPASLIPRFQEYVY